MSTPKKIYLLAFSCWFLSIVTVGLFQIYTPPTTESLINIQNDQTQNANQSLLGINQTNPTIQRLNMSIPYQTHILKQNLVATNQTWSIKTKDEEEKLSIPPIKFSSSPPMPPFHPGMIDKAAIAKENITSYCIITCDVILIIIYILIAYFIQT